MKSNSKNYDKMTIKEISKELRDVMRFEQESFKKIEDYLKKHKIARIWQNMQK